MTLRKWLALTGKSNPELFRLIYDFNLRPQHWAHHSVLERLPHDTVWKTLASSQRGHRRASRWITEQLGLADQGFWDFVEPRRRLALLPGETLERLARFCGAALHWPQFTRLIARDEIQKVRDALGAEPFAFALRRGRILLPDGVPAEVQSGRDLSEAARETGWTTLHMALADAPQTLSARLRVKLAPGTPASVRGIATEETSTRAWGFIRRVCDEVLTDSELRCFA